MATFSASVPLNMRWQTRGRVVDIVSSARSGVPLPAGSTFTVPDDLATEFEDVHGQKLTVRQQVQGAVIVQTTETNALIRGLTRIS